jgi:uncharacterized SAM-binding protein YcdF (DUF218 family)
MKEGFGRVLVISEARRRDWTAGSRLCSGNASFPVVCFRATPYTTRGEARQVAALGAQHHWSSFLVVTSTYHVTRARLLYNRCIPGKVDVIGADPKASRLEWLARIVHEWGGVADARFAARTC